MRARFKSGREMDIPDHHTVFTPVGDCQEGDRVDPATVDVAPESPTLARPGQKLVIDNVIEVLDLVTV